MKIWRRKYEKSMKIYGPIFLRYNYWYVYYYFAYEPSNPLPFICMGSTGKRNWLLHRCFWFVSWCHVVHCSRCSRSRWRQTFILSALAATCNTLRGNPQHSVILYSAWITRFSKAIVYTSTHTCVSMSVGVCFSSRCILVQVLRSCYAAGTRTVIIISSGKRLWMPHPQPLCLTHATANPERCIFRSPPRCYLI